MANYIGQLTKTAGAWFDRLTQSSTTNLARQTSRRGFISRFGTLILGASALPLLPVTRSFSSESLAEIGDPQSCDYWRYCALGGTLCSCCGGTMNSCPPGSQPSPITWVGTCQNPTDGKDYLISYNDCCGKEVCNRCGCHNTERDRPVYYPAKSNDVLWCFGVESNQYHCTVAIVMGDASTS